MSIIQALINVSTGVILIRLDMETVGDRETDVSSNRRERRFKLRGGVVCLDFVNTVGSRLTDRHSEYLRSYADLLDWGRQAGLLAPEKTEDLSRQAALDPEGARETLSRALALREAIHRLISRAVAGEAKDESDLSALNRELSIALSRLRVIPAGGAYGWGWDRGGDDGGVRPDSPLWPVARSAAELLTSSKLSRAKVCAGEG